MLYRLVWGQIRALTWPKLYMSNNIMFQNQILVAKFHRITRLNLHQGMQEILTETANGIVTGFVTIPGVIFFPGKYISSVTMIDKPKTKQDKTKQNKTNQKQKQEQKTKNNINNIKQTNKQTKNEKNKNKTKQQQKKKPHTHTFTTR